MVRSCTGRALVLSCLADAFPTPTYNWTVCSQDQPQRQLLIDQNGELVLSPSGLNRAGCYACKAVNEAGESVVQMNVKAPTGTFSVAHASDTN